MKDDAFNRISIKKEILYSDYIKYPSLTINESKIISDALLIAKLGYIPPLVLGEVPFKGKVTYRCTKLEDDLILRKSNSNLRKRTRVKQRNRDEIVGNLVNLLREGIPYRIYRLDIKSFYESFDHDYLYERINKEKYFDPHTKKLIISFFNSFAALGKSGLPRGLSISASLSEYLMAGFDRFMLRSSEVNFYARYVDDIIVITKGTEITKDFIQKVSNILPKGLVLNNKKQFHKLVEKVRPVKQISDVSINVQFDYLGYKFTVSDPIKPPGSNPQDGKFFREVYLDIAANKTNKIKFKITKSLMEFYRKGNFSLLKSRIKLLTNNYNVLDRSLGIKINVGIFGSYHRVNAEKSEALKVLDDFLAKAIFTNGFKNPHKPFNLSNFQRKELAKASFYRGFINRSFVYFSPKYQKKLQKCWTYAI